MQKKRKSANAVPRRSQATADLLDSLAELERYAAKGLNVSDITQDIKQRDSRRIRVVFSAPQPRKYPPERVRALREAMGMSQAMFAQVIGVSRILVQSWERGVRVPSPLAARLLDTISADPAGWLERLQSSGPPKRHRPHRKAG